MGIRQVLRVRDIDAKAAVYTLSSLLQPHTGMCYCCFGKVIRCASRMLISKSILTNWKEVATVVLL